MTSEVKAQTREAQVPKAPAQVEKKEMTDQILYCISKIKVRFNVNF